MDLLWKNPRYFMESYLDLTFGQYVIAFFVGLLISAVVFVPLVWKRKTKKIYSGIGICVTALYFAFLIAITLLSQQRTGMRNVYWNPLDELRQFLSGNPHVIRGVISNIFLFIPLGFIVSWRLAYKKHLWGILAGLLVSCGIEILQYVFFRGCAQVADCICNVIGTGIGICIVQLCIVIKRFTLRKGKEI